MHPNRIQGPPLGHNFQILGAVLFFLLKKLVAVLCRPANIAMPTLAFHLFLIEIQDEKTVAQYKTDKTFKSNMHLQRYYIYISLMTLTEFESETSHIQDMFFYHQTKSLELIMLFIYNISVSFVIFFLSNQLAHQNICEELYIDLLSILTLLNVKYDKSKFMKHTYIGLFEKSKSLSSLYILNLLKLYSFCDEVLLSLKLKQVRKRPSSHIA